jgi:glycosyltransferase A (GT-A) superfamily protein (DUF2064 family)
VEGAGDVNLQIVVVAKEPLPGKVKTRLQPHCTPHEAARIAEAALADTLTTASRTPAVRRILLLDGDYPAPQGWEVTRQRGEGLAVRLANGFAETSRPGVATLLIGMDTPQVTPSLLDAVARGLSNNDAVLGPAEDGGWWALALRDPLHGKALATVPMSRPDTAELTEQALTRQGLSVGHGSLLRDVDTIGDLHAVAALCPSGSRFQRTVSAMERR